MPQVLYNRGIQAPPVVTPPPPVTIWAGVTLPTACNQFTTNYNLISPASTNNGAYFRPTNAATLATAFANASQAGNGDVIVIPRGTPITITSPINLINKSGGTGWIYVIPDTLDPTSGNYSPGNLPVAGVRIDPSNTSYMGTITFNTSTGYAVTSNNNAHHYRFVGINFDATGSTSKVYYGVYLSHGDTSTSTLCNNITLDRCIIHGDNTYGCTHGYNMDGNYIEADSCYFYNCLDYQNGSDAQAIFFANSNGPYRINNCYLEASVECMIVGGIPLSITNVLPSDIQLTKCYFYRRTNSVDSKNLLEFKMGQRILIDSCHFESMFENANQGGQAVNFSNIDQTGNATNPWITVQDVTMTNCNFNNCPNGITINGQAEAEDTPATGAPFGARYLFRNIRFWANDATGLNNGDNLFFLIENAVSNIVFDHITMVKAAANNLYDWLWIDGTNVGIYGKVNNLVFTNCVLDHKSNYGWSGSGNVTNIAFLNTVFYNDTGYGGTNFYPASEAAIGFTNLSGQDFSLAPTSPYKGLGLNYAGVVFNGAGVSDGTDLGINAALIP